MRQSVAVGLKGTLMQGSILTGKVGDEDPTSHPSTEKEALHPFLPVAETEQELAPELKAIEASETTREQG